MYVSAGQGLDYGGFVGRHWREGISCCQSKSKGSGESKRELNNSTRAFFSSSSARCALFSLTSVLRLNGFTEPVDRIVHTHLQFWLLRAGVQCHVPLAMSDTSTDLVVKRRGGGPVTVSSSSHVFSRAVHMERSVPLALRRLCFLQGVVASQVSQCHGFLVS